MSTHSAAVRKWPHVDCYIATAVNLHGYCSEEVALCWFVIFHTLILLFLFLAAAPVFLVPVLQMVPGIIQLVLACTSR